MSDDPTINGQAGSVDEPAVFEGRSLFEGHKARKRFGQNFLHDQRIIQRIVSSIAPKAGQVMLEVGPGQGAITKLLLQHEPQLTAVELDRDLAAGLRIQFADDKNFSLIEGDVLQFSVAQLQAAPHSVRVVGNLPYNISTPLLFQLLEQREYIADMHFMLQKEVVDRMAASPGGRDYGRLSIMVQYACRVTHLFDVPPGAFNPPPKVTSAIVRLQPCEPLLAAHNFATFARVVNVAFQQRRKTLRNTLKALMNEEQLCAAGVDPAARAETLSVEDFVRLANILATAPAIASDSAQH
jgi:16S rRNA (adenine1518-N6/adenine1519-N6)-dimethyltransferase